MNISKYKDHAESFIKLLTISLGILYFIGILVQSISSDSLGIPADSFLQIRSVMIGISFLIYVLLFTIVFVSLLLCVILLLSPIIEKDVRSFFRYFFIPAVLLIPYSVGIFIGFMTPWGRSWEESYWFSKKSWNWSFMKKDVVDSFNNVSFAFDHPKIKVMCFIILVFLFFRFLKILNRHNESIIDVLINILIPENKFTRAIFIGICISIIPMLFFTYSVDIFPNIRANMGGGQPNIVEITYAQPDSIIANTVNYSVKQQNVLWKQAETFTYLSQIDSPITRNSSIVAVKTSSIEKIRFLNGYVIIKDGNQITNFLIKK